MASHLPHTTRTMTIIVATVLCGQMEVGGIAVVIIANLNGVYGDNEYSQGVNWEDWKTLRYSLKSTVMKVRRP